MFIFAFNLKFHQKKFKANHLPSYGKMYSALKFGWYKEYLNKRGIFWQKSLLVLKKEQKTKLLK